MALRFVIRRLADCGVRLCSGFSGVSGSVATVTGRLIRSPFCIPEANSSRPNVIPAFGRTLQVFIVKTLLKSTVRTSCRIVAAPAVLACRLQSAVLGEVGAFAGWSQLFSLLPGISGEYLRHAFYSLAAGQCEDGVCIGFGTIGSHPGLRMGRSVYIGNYCSLGDVTIEQDVLIASHVSVMNGCRQHGTSRLDIPIREQPGELEPVTIGEGSWIGERATVAADVGRHCIVGAGSLVLNPIPDYAIAVGSPARVIGDRRTRKPSDEDAAADAMAVDASVADRQMETAVTAGLC